MLAKMINITDVSCLQITSLVTLQLLSVVGNNDQLDGPRYKCTVSLDFIRAIARWAFQRPLVLYVPVWMRLKTYIFPSLYVSSLQIRMGICGYLWRMSEWVLSAGGVELEISFNPVLKNSYLRVTGVGQGTALVCHSNILSLCLMKVRSFLWIYWSKTAIHFITRDALWY